MFEWFDGMETTKQVFAVCAIIGGILFVIRLVMQFTGGIDDVIDVDAEAGEGAGDSDAAFRLLSLQFLVSFILMFGLVGLLLTDNTELDPLWCLLGAGVAGFCTGWAMQKAISLMMRLQHSGTLDMNQAVGAYGRVYLRIPAEGTGRVQVNVQDRLIETDAASADDRELPTGTRVRVTRLAGPVLVVEPVGLQPEPAAPLPADAAAPDTAPSVQPTSS